MTTVLLTIIACVLGLAFLLAVYWVVQSFVLAREPRAGELHTVTTPDDWEIRLSRYKREGPAGEPVFLCHGASGNELNFSSPPGNSLIDFLAEQGYDCWAVDLRGCRSSRAPLGRSRYEATMDGHLLNDLPAALDYIRQQTQYEKVHWIGHSMGGMLLYAFVLAFGNDRIASGTTLGSPPGFKNVADPDWPIVRRLVRIMPGVCEFFMRFGTPWLPILRVGTKRAPINWDNVHPDIGPATYFNLVEIIPPSVLDTLVVSAQTNEWWVKHLEINVFGRFDEIDAPMFLIYGVSDPFTPRQNAEVLFEALPSPDKRFLWLSKENGFTADYNHVDLAFAKNGREEVFTPIAEWLREHTVSIQPGNEFDLPAAPATANPGEDTSWRKALRKAAEVMTGMSGEDQEAEGEPLLSTSKWSWPDDVPVEKKKTKAPRRKAAAKQVAAKASTKTKAKAKKKPAAKKKSAAAKTTAKKASTKPKSSNSKAKAKNSTKKKSPTKTKTEKKSSTKTKSTKKSSTSKSSAKKPAAKKSTAKKPAAKKKTKTSAKKK